jgi:hypothetical protein
MVTSVGLMGTRAVYSPALHSEARQDAAQFVRSFDGDAGSRERYFLSIVPIVNVKLTPLQNALAAAEVRGALHLQAQETPS